MSKILKKSTNTPEPEKDLENLSPIMQRAKNVKAQCSLLAMIIADGHKLERTGKQYRACCPFHEEETPSFYLLPGELKAKCFGCEWSGDIIDYVKQTRKLDFST
ncbi:MAG: CHC2 zinc finger domain-containing protein, partial [Terrimicrobiaceae bacterium]